MPLSSAVNALNEKDKEIKNTNEVQNSDSIKEPISAENQVIPKDPPLESNEIPNQNGQQQNSQLTENTAES